MKHTAGVIVLSMLIMLQSGCKSDVGWRTYFNATRAVDVLSQDPLSDVQLRHITLDQVRQVGVERQRYLDDQDLAPEDITPSNGRALRQIAMDVYRHRADGAEVTLLGVSAFTSNLPASQIEQELVAFARSIGADTVFVATEYAGEKAGVSHTPVTSFSSVSVNANVWNSDGTWSYGNAYGSGITTTYVPIPVIYQQWTNYAEFVRHIEREERLQLDSMYRSQD